MKKIKIAIGILFFISIILVSDNVFGLDNDWVFIDENGFDDWERDVSYYAPKCTISSGVKATCSTSGDKVADITEKVVQSISGNSWLEEDKDVESDKKINATIKVNPEGNVYVGDTLTVTFYMMSRSSVYLLDEAEVKSTDKYKIVNIEGDEPNDDGTAHLRVKVEIALLEKGMTNVPIDIILYNEHYKKKAEGFDLKVNVSILNVLSQGSKIADIYRKKGFKDINITEPPGVTYGTETKARTRIIKDGIVSTDKINSQNISFAQLTDGEFADYKMLYTSEMSYDIKASEDKTVQSYQITGYFEGKPNGLWDSYKLKSGKEYTVAYKFLYFKDADILLYNCAIDRKGESTNRDTLISKEEEGNLEAEETVKAYRLAMSTINDPRDTVEFVDVLQDVTKYSDYVSEELEPADAQKAEEKIGKVLSVITNIGMVLSVIMPAILGVKYMLGSVEEKAEYKKDMIPYFVGAVLLFSICTIVKIVKVIGEEINKI